MQKSLIAIVFILLLVALPVMVSADNPGSIKTSRNDCNNPVNENHYIIGDVVYVRGENFDSNSYNWEITKPNGSGQVANGTIAVNSSASFCFEAYTVQPQDSGEYKVTFGNKRDNYHVDETSIVPEFGMIISLATILGAVAAFMVIRRR